MGRDSYSSIAAHYDRTGMDWFTQTFGSRLIGELTKRVPANPKVLDAGCGTGSLALKFADAGFAVTGVDISESMLQEARRKDTSARVTWRQADLAALDLGVQFDAITCVSDVLSHIESDAQWNAALQGLAKHLVPGGLLFVDISTLRGLENLNSFTMQEHPDRVMTINLIFEPAERRSTMRMTSFVMVPDTNYWERSTESIPAWGRTGSEILDGLSHAGLGSFERPWYRDDDVERTPRLMLFATKQS